MRSRFRQLSWQTAALALAGLVAFAVPAAAKPGPGGKVWSSKATKQGPARQQRFGKLDEEMASRSRRLLGTSKVILTVKPGQEANAEKEIRKLGGRLGRRLKLVNGMAVELPNRVIKQISERSEVLSVHFDRPIAPHNSRTAVSVGARAAQQTWGYDGAGVGVAVIDSGISGWHDDLGYQGSSWKVRVVNGQRVTAFVDFVNDQPQAYDDNGHGTHVAGIIAGDGYDSYGSHAGIAPAAHLVSLKVLDQNGGGVVSDVIAAFEWAIANKAAHNIRVINLSVGARVSESYETDPLTLAAKRAVDAGIVVVAAAGNLGSRTNSSGEKKTQYGSITAPGNAPWVLTVGAYSTQGTLSRWDDKVATYSSRGPTAIDYAAKPDIVAPGSGIVSLSNPASAFYLTKSAYLLQGSRDSSARPYLSLSGTSMASPVVAGTVALMLQANPNLQPNLVKAILQYTAQTRHYDALTQGAGFLNAKGAVELARFFKYPQQGQAYPHSWLWSRQIIWGDHRIKGGVIKPAANAWASNVVWGTLADDQGENIVWGTLCADECENIVWGTAADELENIVWGTVADDGENIVWGTADEGENIVWGTADLENIVWGTTCGGDSCENIVWGTAMDLENIVWGTADDGENIVWGTNMDLENIVWGTAADLENIVWGTSADEDVTWGSNDEDCELFDDPTAPPVSYDATPLEDLFLPPVPTAPPSTGGTEGGL